MKDHSGTRTREKGEGPGPQKTESNCLRTLAPEFQCLGLDLILATYWSCYLRSLCLHFPICNNGDNDGVGYYEEEIR